MSNDAIAVLFPTILPESAPEAMRRAAAFFDPGLGLDPAGGLIVSSSALPLSPEIVRGFLAQYDALAREVKTPRDLETLRGLGFIDTFSDTAAGIQAELADRMTPGRPRASRERLAKAQMTLCLAGRLEERLRELGGLSGDLGRAWDAFGQSLGLDEEDEVAETGIPGSGFSPTLAFENDFPTPWPAVLEALLAFLPPERPLAACDPEIAATLADKGLVLAPAEPALLTAAFRAGASPAMEFQVCRASGSRLIGSGRADPDKPWLDAERILLLGAPREA